MKPIMKIAVAGGAGFVGKNIIEALSSHPEVEIILLDMTSGIDICDWSSVCDVKADLYIHLANKSFVPDSYRNPMDFYRVNLNGTLNMLELARLNKARLIYFSSYVYGHPEYLPIDEAHPLKSFNPYSNTKLMCEQMCRGYSEDFGVEVAIVRPFNIYGLGQRREFILPKMVEQIRRDGNISIGDDRPKRDFIHVRDVASAIETLCFSAWPALCDAYNIGSGRSYSIREVAMMIMDIWGKEVAYLSKPDSRPGDVMDTVADIRKLKSLGWTPKVTLDEGLREMLFAE